jgi:asparagine synthase (glutamine-hydrolysing)
VSGFVAIVNRGGQPVDASLLTSFTRIMAHCGPDHQETWWGDGIGLGHALLAASPDPPAEEFQPASLDGQVRVVADARIDGRDELVAAMRSRGRTVLAQSPDAHLILHAYATWGARCVEHLIGDFAFAIWDEPCRRLFCARDHFGVVPFYYASLADGVAVGNVLRSLLAHPEVSATLNERAVADFLLFGLNMDHTATTYHDVGSLPPAHTLTFQDGALRLHRYWDPEPAGELRFERRQDFVDAFRDRFDQAVSDRLRSSRCGAFLSGGMDSTSIVATAKRVSPGLDLRAYTIVYERLFEEEEGWLADLVAEYTGVSVERFVAEDYLMRGSHTVQWTFPEPGMDPSSSAEYAIGQRLASFARSMLSGMGGDPLFQFPATWPSGAAQWYERLRYGLSTLRAGRVPRYGVPAAWRRALPRSASKTPPPTSWIDSEFARRVGIVDRLREVREEWRLDADGRAMLHPKWANMFAQSHPAASGLPFRTLFPFFDLRLVRYVWSTPRYPWRPEKRLLREAMGGRLPRAILQRPKTPLYVAPRKPDPRHPFMEHILGPEAQRRRIELLSIPGIGEYVDVGEAHRLIGAPGLSPRFPSFDNCFRFARWLGAARDEPLTPKETSHAVRQGTG